MSFVKLRCPHCDAINDVDASTCSACGKETKRQIHASVPAIPAPRKRAGGMVITLVAVAVVAGGLGLLMLSQATMGVGLIAFGCLCAVLARIEQAANYHSQQSR